MIFLYKKLPPFEIIKFNFFYSVRSGTEENRPITKDRSTVSVRCGAAQLVVRRLAVRQARVRISSRHPMEAPLAERRRDEDSRRRASANGEG
jgi:hypothetical protein